MKWVIILLLILIFGCELAEDVAFLPVADEVDNTTNPFPNKNVTNNTMFDVSPNSENVVDS